MAKKKKNNEPPRAKVGKCWYVCGYDGKPKIGLSWDKATGYFFPTHYKQTDDFKKSGKRPLFSKNYDTALGLFGLWQSRNKNYIHVITTVTKHLSEKDKEWYKKFYAEIGLQEDILWIGRALISSMDKLG